MNHIAVDQVRSLLGASFFNPAYMLVGQAWSLSSEIFFYMLAPLAVRSPVRIVALLAISLSVRFAIVSAGWTSGLWCYWFFPATMCMFALGSLSYSLYRRIASWRWSAPIGWCAVVAMSAWMIVVSVLYGLALPVNGTNSLDEPRFWLAYLIFAALLPFVFCATKRVAIDRLIGDLSYPLYVVHGLMIGIVFNRMGRPQDSAWLLVAAVAASILAAVMMRSVVEAPTERYLLRTAAARA